MGNFLIGHDVLWDYMFHFLHGHRFVWHSNLIDILTVFQPFFNFFKPFFNFFKIFCLETDLTDFSKKIFLVANC